MPAKVWQNPPWFPEYLTEIAKVEATMLSDHTCGATYDLEHVVAVSMRDLDSPRLWHLTSGLSISDISYYGARPLHIAAAAGQVEIARILINHGASVDGLDDFFQTPLHLAAIYGQTEAIEFLIHSGADVNARDLHLTSPCLSAARHGHLMSVKALIDAGAEPRLQDFEDRTALFAAAKFGHFNVGVFLINEVGRFNLAAETKSGESILSAVLSYSSSFLLNLAPNPSVYEPRKDNILTATAKFNDPGLLRRLLRRLPRNLTPTLLTHRALLRGTPLYAAATRCSEKIIDMLLDAGADLELEGGDHGSPLMGACAAGRLEMVKALVRKGAKTSYTKDGTLFSALSTAKLYPKITRWLLVGRFMEGPLLIENGTV